MGGDHAPDIVVGGAARTLERHPHTHFLIFGDEVRLRPLVERSPKLRERAEVRHTPESIGSDEKPGLALRRGRNSSMRLAIDAVRDGHAAGIVSAGNTGALMAMSKFVLRTLPGIDRPALVSFVPTLRGEAVMLDLGANVECDATNLVQFAVMGANFAYSVLGRMRPTVGLLNVGSEDVKGNDTVKEAAEILRRAGNLPFEFLGFVEGDDIAKGTVDVIVTDGFTGNVALKTMEGTAKLVSGTLSSVLRLSVMTRIGYLFSRSAMMALRERMDPRQYNGGVFLGLNGIAVKSHGGTDDVGFATAIELAIEMALDKLTERITTDFAKFQASVDPEIKAATS